MTDDRRAAENRARRSRKLRDAAVVLTVLGVVLFASPLISVVAVGNGSSTVPLAVQYVFNVWGALIVLSFVLSRQSRREDDDK